MHKNRVFFLAMQRILDQYHGFLYSV